jgi:preprotein translocase subunit YajC
VELLLPLVGIALLWFFLIRPASRRQKELARLQSALGIGDEVMLTSGIFGTVTEVGDDHLRLEVAPGVVVKVVRGAVGRVMTDASSQVDDAGNAGNAGNAVQHGETDTDDGLRYGTDGGATRAVDHTDRTDGER